MKTILLFVFGFFCALFALTAVGSTSFIGVAILYGILLYLLFFVDYHNALVLLLGTTLALELLGSQHLGLASTLALTAWSLHYFFALQLRFTSLFARYIVALLLMLTAYNLLFFSFTGFFHRLVILLIVAGAIILAGLYRAATQPGPAYELI